MSMSDLEHLIAMGFDEQRAKLAITNTGGIQGAIDWLERHQDKSLEDLEGSEDIVTAAGRSEEANESTAAEEARSLMCNDCGRKLRSQAQAEYHATKTGHIDFAESTEEIAPLTDLEKKAKLEELRAKAAARKAAASVEDTILHKRNEEIRRKTTKETSDLKDQLRKKEQLKEAAMKRKEKQDDIDAKKRIQAKIAADKEERRLKAAKDKVEHPPRDSTGISQIDSITLAAATRATSKPAATYTDTRLRFQIVATGSTIQMTFPVTTNLFQVAAAVSKEAGIDISTFTQNFPKKTYDSNDFENSLKDLGLIPSAALIAK